MWSDGHYTIGTQTDPAERAPALVDQLADWLRSFFAKLRFPGPDSYLPSRTLVVVTFDEADFEKGYTKALQSTYDGPNQIYSVLLGDHLEPTVEIGEGYNHYSLLHTIERNFGLGDLGKNDAGANWFRFLWGRHFAWGPSSDTGLLSAGSLAAVEHQGRLHVATVDDSGKITVQKRDDLGWVHVGTVDGPCTGGLALGSNGFSLIVTWRDSEGSLRAGPLDDGQQKLLAKNAGQYAAVADLPDGTLMVAWEGHEANKDNQRQIFSCTGDGGDLGRGRPQRRSHIGRSGASAAGSGSSSCLPPRRGPSLADLEHRRFQCRDCGRKAPTGARGTTVQRTLGRRAVSRLRTGPLPPTRLRLASLSPRATRTGAAPRSEQP